MGRVLRFETKTGVCDLEAAAVWVGSDLLVWIQGGEAPHIGAVAMAQPRPSLADPNKVSATTSVFAYVGHKEDMLAQKAAQTLASALNTRVVVTAGAHWDNLDSAGIKKVMANFNDLLGVVLQGLLRE
ncbi:hypothetical protein [Dethiosulfatarculus sandiegensis]|uniref:Prenylated flavin chaperone LpdD-like domain-containing protein n=1 Tax=Dethiosulfatarculus sandiegensis TaxID=1429043 RepID=A0A0D2J2Z3_9BACT|nr:hypothetical protein [Dethiosulfatarculus sandiegensis]KIX12529.1 hypothetical protein X474_18165 [Dethiosulfatarculus sandiegensis]